MEKLGFTKRNAPKVHVLKIVNSPGNEFAIMNTLAVHPNDFPDNHYVICDNRYVLTTKTSNKLEPGTVGAYINQRLWASWSIGQEIPVSSFDMFKSTGQQSYLGSMNLEISFRSKGKATQREFDQEELAEQFIARFESQIFQPTQLMIFEFQGNLFDIGVKSVQIVDLGQISLDSVPTSTSITSKGIIVKQTQINFFKGSDGLVNLKASSTRPNADAVIRPDFKFEDMGIGGLDLEFTKIFRRAFASRIFPPGLIDKLGITHVKGLLLYGPPGTGKTLIARRIGSMLNAREPKIVNGPEILSKYVGSSEENIRNLFKDAEVEYKAKGDASSLHIIIFDELDSIFKQRGSRGDGTGVADNVVNQLLSKMDGVDQLNNILVIGMTNRRDLIDEALLRPGRFDVQVEIHLPDEAGRKQILEIKTKKMRENNMLAPDVNLDELAHVSKNFSGAELEGLVKSASSFAINKHIKVGTVGDISGNLANVQVTRKDFFGALDEVKAAFGVHEEDLHTSIAGGILKFSTTIDEILSHGQRYIKQVKESRNTKFISLLMHGPSGSGKTALAASIALASKFPFVRLISPEAMVGMSESSKINYIDNTFRDAYKSPLNILVIDNLEGLIDWVPIGPRFSNPVLQALKVYLKRQPPDGHRLLIISTSSSYSVLKQLDILNCLHNELAVPNLKSLEEFKSVMDAAEFMNDEIRRTVVKQLYGVFGTNKLDIGIKRALVNIDTSSIDEDEVNELVELMAPSLVRENQSGSQVIIKVDT
uniref:Vesicular-fusion protein SEC18 n=1 Tax=Komagataella pastoris TaxID=4922 RepID=Q9P4C9_PICPA|nr:Sec18 [Komagataella pastoris]